jgi:dTDP-4-dehydrorhamnose 3,5-epimerase
VNSSWYTKAMTDSICEIPNVLIKKLNRASDDRGWLTEVFRNDELDHAQYPVMGYISLTKPNAVRGPHEHRRQTDYFYYFGPTTFRVYLWDNRPDSPAYGRHCRLDIDEDSDIAIIIPPGVVHAYKNTGSADGYVLNAPNRLFAGKNKREPVDEIRYEDSPDTPFKIKE